MAQYSMASSVAPVFLRLVLGVTFLWAGLGKVMETQEFTGADAALLTGWGVGKAGTTPMPAVEPAQPATGDGTQKDAVPVAAPPAAAPGAPEASGSATTAASVGPVTAMRLYGIATGLYHGAQPAPVGAPVEGTTTSTTTTTPNTTSTTTTTTTPSPMVLIPAKAAEGRYPVILAWAAAITELAGGVLVLIGFMTRLASLGFVSVMAVAMWMTEIGPAIISGNTKLGFLPNHPTFGHEWQHLLIQFLVMGASLALLFAGAGMLSLDRLLFTRPTVIVRPAPDATVTT